MEDIQRLSAAFAELTGERSAGGRADEDADRPCEVSPRAIVEAMLFVGTPDNQPISAREMAAAIRGVSPQEVDAAVAELNEIYRRDGSPYTIDSSAAGYRLVLCEAYARMRDKFQGRLREAKLSRAAIEVLAIVAYNQPVTSAEVGRLREAASGAHLSMLVRRKLIRLERSDERGREPLYYITDRCLKVLGLASLDELPQYEELQVA